MPNIRKPNNLHHITGTYRPDRHGVVGDTLDDKKLPGLPPPPDWLHPVGVVEWKRVVDILEPYGLLKATDYGILLGYCQLFVGLTVTEPDKIKPSHYTQFRGYCNDLGLTPVARSKVRLGDGKNKDGDGNPYSGF